MSFHQRRSAAGTQELLGILQSVLVGLRQGLSQEVLGVRRFVDSRLAFSADDVFLAVFGYAQHLQGLVEFPARRRLAEFVSPEFRIRLMPFLDSDKPFQVGLCLRVSFPCLIPELRQLLSTLRPCPRLRRGEGLLPFIIEILETPDQSFEHRH